MSVRVQTGSLRHEIHDLRGLAIRREELERRFSSTARKGGVIVGSVSVDISSVDKASNDDDGSIAQHLCGGIPSLFL